MKHELTTNLSPINFFRNAGVNDWLFLSVIALFIVLYGVPMGLGLISFNVNYETTSLFQRACVFAGALLALGGILVSAESRKQYKALTAASLVVLITPLFVQ